MAPLQGKNMRVCMIRPSLVSALKELNIPAQGNALGQSPTPISSPEGAKLGWVAATE